MRKINLVIPYVLLTKSNDKEISDPPISEELKEKIKSSKLLRKLNKLTELNLKEKEPLITISGQEDMDNYYIHFMSYVDKSILQSPIDYLIKKGVVKKRERPLRVRYVEKDALLSKTSKIVRLDLREHQAVAYITFYPKE
jgi:hypothetical protein